MDDFLAVRERPAPQETVVGPDNQLVKWSAPAFKTVPTTTSRKGLRLEAAFWEALATIASWSGVKRHKLVARVVEEAEEFDLNSASALRSYAIQTMGSEVARLRKINETDFAIGLLQQAPVPSFAVDANKRVLRVNGEFNQFIRILFAETSEPASRRSLQLNLETPVTEVFATLGQSGEGKTFMLNVVVDGKTRRTRTRIVAIPPHDPKVLVGYILP